MCTAIIPRIAKTYSGTATEYDPQTRGVLEPLGGLPWRAARNINLAARGNKTKTSKMMQSGSIRPMRESGT